MSATQQETANPLEAASYEEVIKVIQHWSPKMRTSLIHYVLDTLATQEETPNRWENARARAMDRASIEDVEVEERPRHKKNTFARANGLLKTDAPAPTDEEVEQWLRERRVERYG